MDVAKDVCKIFNLEAEKAIKFVDNRPFNDQRYFLDDEKLKELGWSSERTHWEEDLRKTVEWYVADSDYWGDVSGALLRHPKAGMMPGNESSEGSKGMLAQFMAQNQAKAAAVPASEQHATKAVENNGAPVYTNGALISDFLICMCNVWTPLYSCPFRY